MNISYRVLSSNPVDNSLLVRYWTDIATENTLATSFDVNGNIMLTPNGWPISTRTDYNLTLFNSDPSMDDLEYIINKSAPLSFLQMQENTILNPSTVISGFSNANSMIGVSGTVISNTSNISVLDINRRDSIVNDTANAVLNMIPFAFIRRQMIVDTANFVLDYLKANNSFAHWPQSSMWLMTPPKYIDEANTADPPVYINANGISMTLDSRTFCNNFPGLVHFEGLVQNISVSGNESLPLSFTPDYLKPNTSIEEVFAMAKSKENSDNT